MGPMPWLSGSWSLGAHSSRFWPIRSASTRCLLSGHWATRLIRHRYMSIIGKGHKFTLGITNRFKRSFASNLCFTYWFDGIAMAQSGSYYLVEQPAVWRLLHCGLQRVRLLSGTPTYTTEENSVRRFPVPWACWNSFLKCYPSAGIWLGLRELGQLIGSSIQLSLTSLLHIRPTPRFGLAHTHIHNKHIKTYYINTL